MSWDWAVIWEYFPRLLEGALMTLKLVALSGIAGLAIAVPLALMRASRRPLLYVPAYAYIFFFRGTPLLVQIFLIYYGSSQFTVIKESFLWPVLKEPYWCAIIAFTLNTSAYIAELIRGALQSVPRGEIEVARALGMTRLTLIRRIMLPRAFGIVLPAYSNEVLVMLKSSALASTITLLDITGMARTIIARTYTPLEIFTAAGMIYLVIAAILLGLFRLTERRLNRYKYLRRPA